MAFGYQMTAEQKQEIEKARKLNHDKKIEKNYIFSAFGPKGRA